MERGELPETWHLSTVEFRERLAGKRGSGGRTAPPQAEGKSVLGAKVSGSCFLTQTLQAGVFWLVTGQ